jgi:fructokinase
MSKQIINVGCFGEVLWDTFPGGLKRAGGAPFNVAYHLNKMGVNTYMISSVGDDELGHELIHKITAWDISKEGIQVTNEHPTSQVIAVIDENNEAHYEIVENVAWDFIKCLPADQEKLTKMDALVFGTLATRNKTSRDTLFELIESSSFNIFDINLRPPYYSISLIQDLLHKSHLAKFNKAEMKMILDFLGKEYNDEADSLHYLQDTFDIQEIIVSKGSKGALYGQKDHIYDYPAITVQVKDTVGSGDSFLAGFISKRLEQTATAHEIMTNAVALGAFITSNEGACPEYDIKDFEFFKEANNIRI